MAHNDYTFCPPPSPTHPLSPQSSTSPSYSHLLLLELGIQCPPSAMLKFEVFSVSYSPTDDKDRCHLVSSTQETAGAPVSHQQAMHIHVHVQYVLRINVCPPFCCIIIIIPVSDGN